MIPFLAERIMEVRIKNGLNQSEFSDRLGINKSMVSLYENGSRQPSLEILRKIASVFHVSTDYLLSLEDNVSISLSFDTSNLNQEQIDSLATVVKTVTSLYRKNNEALDELLSNLELT